MVNLMMKDAIELYKKTAPPKKVLKIQDINIEVKPLLSADEVKDFTCLMMTYIANSVQNFAELLNIDWAIRTATILTYTNFTFEDMLENNDVKGFTEFLYGTPLYAMLVGSPAHPVYFNGEAYTEPAIETEQFYAIIESVKNTLAKSINLVKQPHESE